MKACMVPIVGSVRKKEHKHTCQKLSFKRSRSHKVCRDTNECARFDFHDIKQIATVRRLLCRWSVR